MIKFTAKILTADEPTVNGHIYPREILEVIVEQAKSLNVILGTGPGHDQGLPISLADVTHQTTNIRLENDTLVGDVTILQTPKGQSLCEFAIETNAKSLDDMGLELVPAGYGTVEKTLKGSTILNYTLHAVNLVIKKASST